MTPNNLLNGARVCRLNAESLINEAEVLLISGYLSRAYFLFQISMEEIAKIEMLGTIAIGLAFGITVDLEKAKKSFRSHESKNKVNSFHMPYSQDELMFFNQGDYENFMRAFEKNSSSYVKSKNDYKNNSLYTGWKGNDFILPESIIKKEDVILIKNEARYRLAQASISLDKADMQINNPSMRKQMKQAMKNPEEFMRMVSRLFQSNSIKKS